MNAPLATGPRSKDAALPTIYRVEQDLLYAVFETLDEFKVSLESTAFGVDEVGYWAMIWSEDGKKYYGPSVREPRPEWATHVYWFGA